MFKNRRIARKSRKARTARFELLEDRALLSAAKFRPEQVVNEQVLNDQYVASVAEFQTVTDQGIVTVFHRQSVAVDRYGNYVVVWTSNTPGQSAIGGDIWARRYNSLNQPLGGEFKINVTRIGHASASIAMDHDGNFVVAFRTAGISGNNPEIYYRRYSATGVPQSEEIKLSNAPAGEPSVAMSADGRSVIAYRFNGIGFARVFDRLGNPLGSNYIHFGQHLMPEVAAGIASDGTVTLAWAEDVNPSDERPQASHNSRILAQRFSSSGVPLGPAFGVSESIPNLRERQPSLSVDAAGNFAIAWTQPNTVNSQTSYDVFLKRFDAAGNPLGEPNPTIVNTRTSGKQEDPSVGLTFLGDLVVTWTDTSAPEDGAGIYGQTFNFYSGERVGGEFHVSTQPIGHQYGAAIAMNQSGDYIAVWTDEGDVLPGLDVKSQFFGLPPSLHGPLSASTVENVPIQVPGFRIDDPDDRGEPRNFFISTSHGSIELNTANLMVIERNPNFIAFVASLANANSALSTIVFHPEVGYAGGDARIDFATDSQGYQNRVVNVFVAVPGTEKFLGDYNGDILVDAADYVMWRRAVGTTVPPFSGADGSGNGLVDHDDNEVWRANFGRTVTIGVGATALNDSSPQEELIHSDLRLDDLRGDHESFAVPPETLIATNSYGQLIELCGALTSTIRQARPRHPVRPATRYADVTETSRNAAIVAWLTTKPVGMSLDAASTVAMDVLRDASNSVDRDRLIQPLDLALAEY
jgi:hypothetical protein